MILSDTSFRRAEKRMREQMKGQPSATSARYDRRVARIIVGLSNGLELGVPVDLAEGLAGAKASDLAEIEISPTGLGLHWPRLDADLYLPALLEGIFGSRRWMAQVMGKAGGRSSSSAPSSQGRSDNKAPWFPKNREQRTHCLDHA